MPLQVTFLAQWASIDILIATRQFRDNVLDPQIINTAHTFVLPIQVGTHREALECPGPIQHSLTTANIMYRRP